MPPAKKRLSQRLRKIREEAKEKKAKARTEYKRSAEIIGIEKKIAEIQEKVKEIKGIGHKPTSMSTKKEIKARVALHEKLQILLKQLKFLKRQG